MRKNIYENEPEGTYWKDTEPCANCGGAGRSHPLTRKGDVEDGDTVTFYLACEDCEIDTGEAATEEAAIQQWNDIQKERLADKIWEAEQAKLK